MRKKISLVIVFSILLLALISIGPPVKAKQEIQQTEYEAIDIYGNQLPNSKYQNGLYEKGLLISPYDFIFTAKENFMLRTGLLEDGTYNFPFFYIFERI